MRERSAVENPPVSADRVKALAACALMVAMLAVLSWIAVPLPFSPVPVTLQTLGVFLAGGLLGPRWGVAAVVAYLLLGLAGVPVFASGEAGPGVLAGAKGGYLVGFVPAACLAGLGSSLSRRFSPLGSTSAPSARVRRTAVLVLGFLAAALAVYVLGVAWLPVVTGLTFSQAVLLGVVPFLPGDGLKIAAATVLVRALAGRLPGIK